MGGGLSRTVEIQIHNKTKDIALTKPMTYLWSGHNIRAPSPRVSPGSSESCRYSSSTIFWGCNGVLAYEAETFTLAIYFCNPVDYNRFSQELGLDLSVDKVHVTKGLRDTYAHLVGGRCCSSSSASQQVTPDTPQEPVKVSAGPVQVTATMSRRRNATIRVEVEDWEGPRKGGRKETPRPGKESCLV